MSNWFITQAPAFPELGDAGISELSETSVAPCELPATRVPPPSRQLEYGTGLFEMDASAYDPFSISPSELEGDWRFQDLPSCNTTSRLDQVTIFPSVEVAPEPIPFQQPTRYGISPLTVQKPTSTPVSFQGDAKVQCLDISANRMLTQPMSQDFNCTNTVGTPAAPFQAAPHHGNRQRTPMLRLQTPSIQDQFTLQKCASARSAASLHSSTTSSSSLRSSPWSGVFRSAVTPLSSRPASGMSSSQFGASWSSGSPKRLVTSVDTESFVFSPMHNSNTPIIEVGDLFDGRFTAPFDAQQPTPNPSPASSFGSKASPINLAQHYLPEEPRPLNIPNKPASAPPAHNNAPSLPSPSEFPTSPFQSRKDQCPRCNKRFKSKPRDVYRNVQRHMMYSCKALVGRRQTIQCESPNCRQMFTRDCARRVHEKAVHADEGLPRPKPKMKKAKSALA